MGWSVAALTSGAARAIFYGLLAPRDGVGVWLEDFDSVMPAFGLRKREKILIDHSDREV